MVFITTSVVLIIILSVIKKLYHYFLLLVPLFAHSICMIIFVCLDFLFSLCFYDFYDIITIAIFCIGLIFCIVLIFFQLLLIKQLLFSHETVKATKLLRLFVCLFVCLLACLFVLFLKLNCRVIIQRHCFSAVPERLTILFIYCYFNIILHFILSFTTFCRQQFYN